MSKASIICESCGRDNELGATFCIECGTSISISKLGKSLNLEKQDPPNPNSTNIRRSEDQNDETFQSESKASSPFFMRCWHMMRMNMNPMFIMMPIMIIVMVFIVFRRFDY
ncbi:MAG: hypothetical protein HeimC2_31140 [Candidatus Heimdallarchaeota archaeon LC_2]|nr:MAG: hypothetical protein HeimC2_31140 [Candidatus Heimdallarchaeota archaeon LC_2]